jgi:hypothetical protein
MVEAARYANDSRSLLAMYEVSFDTNSVLFRYSNLPAHNNWQMETGAWIWPESSSVVWKPAGRHLGHFLAIYRNWV